MNAVDTNVLLYVHDPRDVTKQVTASNLLQSLTDGVLLWQVACEYLAASRKLVPFGYNLIQAYQDVRDLSAFGLRFYLRGACLIERRHW
jgi:predicted nucleic acid-binding protein